MDSYTATEQAYKNGYAKGYADGKRMDKLTAELEKTKALLTAAVAELQSADVNCTYCSHKHPPAPCSQDDEHYTCEDCPYDCYCKDCKDNSKWEWHKNKEESK